MKIWAAWFQGRSVAPESVKRILHLWEAFNPDHELHVIEQSEADAILQKLGIRQDRISPQITSDLVRLWLLNEHGGTWVDATVLPSAPLDTWLPALREPAGLFAFASTGDPNHLLQTWFISASPGNVLIEMFLMEFSRYFGRRRLFPTWKRALRHGALKDYHRFRQKIAERDTLWFVDPEGGFDNAFYPYAVINYTLASLLNRDPALAAIWQKVPHRSAAVPQLIGSLAGDPETPDATFLRHAAEISGLCPVHKLNYRDRRFSALADIVMERNGLRPFTGSTASRAG